MASALINGILPLRLPTGNSIFIVGGPYKNYLQSGVSKFAGGACLVEREPTKSNVWLPIEDFSVPRPDEHDKVTQALIDILTLANTDGLVWVGCMGGWGRTGLVMALLTKAAGYPDPVAYVREFYTEHAVETPTQMDYVDNFDVSDVQAFLNAAAEPDDQIDTSSIIQQLDEPGFEADVAAATKDDLLPLNAERPNFWQRLTFSVAHLFGRA